MVILKIIVLFIVVTATMLGLPYLAAYAYFYEKIPCVRHMGWDNVLGFFSNPCGDYACGGAVIG